MLWQLHHILSDGTREFIAQTENPQRQEWFDDLKKSHPLPHGAIREMVSEEHPNFFVSAE